MNIASHRPVRRLAACAVAAVIATGTAHAQQQGCLPLNGIYILENMNTEEMVKDQGVGVSVHARALAHHRRGAGIINPIAIR